MDIYSKVISGSVYHLVKTLGAYRISFQAVGGAAQFKGGFSIANGQASEYLPLASGDTVTLAADPNSPIEIYIDPMSASVSLMIFYS